MNGTGMGMDYHSDVIPTEPRDTEAYLSPTEAEAVAVAGPTNRASNKNGRNRSPMNNHRPRRHKKKSRTHDRSQFDRFCKEDEESLTLCVDAYETSLDKTQQFVVVSSVCKRPPLPNPMEPTASSLPLGETNQEAFKSYKTCFDHEEEYSAVVKDDLGSRISPVSKDKTPRLDVVEDTLRQDYFSRSLINTPISNPALNGCVMCIPTSDDDEITAGNQGVEQTPYQTRTLMDICLAEEEEQAEDPGEMKEEGGGSTNEIHMAEEHEDASSCHGLGHQHTGTINTLGGEDREETLNLDNHKASEFDNRQYQDRSIKKNVDGENSDRTREIQQVLTGIPLNGGTNLPNGLLSPVQSRGTAPMLAYRQPFVCDERHEIRHYPLQSVLSDETEVTWISPPAKGFYHSNAVQAAKHLADRFIALTDALFGSCKLMTEVCKTSILTTEDYSTEMLVATLSETSMNSENEAGEEEDGWLGEGEVEDETISIDSAYIRRVLSGDGTDCSV